MISGFDFLPDADSFLQDLGQDYEVELPTTKTNTKKSIPGVKPTISKPARFSSEPSPSLFYTREELLNLSSDQLMDQVKRIETERPLSLKEKEEVKKSLRLIKNREAAQAHRNRRKGKITEMEKTIKILQDENQQLREELRVLKEENKVLRSPNWNSNISPQSTPSLSSNSSPSSPLSSPLSFEQIIPEPTSHFWQIGTHKMESTAKTLGLCLFVFLFSCGLFFNSMNTVPVTPLNLPQFQPGTVLAKVNQPPVQQIQNSFSHFAASSFVNHPRDNVVGKADYIGRHILGVGDMMDETENETSAHEPTPTEAVFVLEEYEPTASEKQAQLAPFSEDLITVKMKLDSANLINDFKYSQFDLIVPPNSFYDYPETLMLTVQVAQVTSL